MARPPETDLLAFVRASLRSVWALELLLLLHRTPQGPLTHAEAVRELRASDAVVTNCARQLETAGLIARGADGACKYAPAAPVLAELCDALAETYAERPLAIINTIAQASNETLRTFADAFRLTKGNDE